MISFSSCTAGVFELRVTCLVNPKKSTMIRCLNENFVNVLKERMEADPSSPGVPPLAVLCTDHKVCESSMHNIPNFYDPYSSYTWRALNLAFCSKLNIF